MPWISIGLIGCAGLLLVGGMVAWSVRAVRAGQWTNLYKVTVRRCDNPLGFWLPVIFLPLLAVTVVVGLLWVMLNLDA